MKKYLLPENGSFYKANLHCHSNVSDGKLTPAEIKAAYKEMGYSVVAYTDHNVLIPHDELTDDEFVAFNGFEVDINELHGYDFDENNICKNDPKVKYIDWRDQKVCHICFIALDTDNTVQPNWNPAYAWGNAANYANTVKYESSEPPHIRKYGTDNISKYMRTCRDKGFFVTYNHPVWSMENFEQYTNYDGMHAMEICNYGCLACGYGDYSPQAYDDMLRCGKRIFAIAADDNHNHAPLSSRHCDSFGGFVMIKAQGLDYRSITSALQRGEFYASQGPKINALYVEGNEVHIECELADQILFTTGTRHAEARFDERGTGITSATFKISPEMKYFRLTVIDKSGKPANTNAYFIDEIL